jgi:hypothetical protein
VRHRVIAAELKCGKGKLRPNQREWLAALRAAGVEAVEWRPEQWAEIVATLEGKN